MASTIYVTSGGEILDLIALDHYGTHIGTTELVLAANPGLAEQPPVLPPGITITLPAAPATSTATKPVKLYD